MSLGIQIEQTTISAFVDLIGHGSVFSRVVAEIERTNALLPSATGAEKREKVLKDIEIIFDDLVEPIAKSVINLLIELGVTYLCGVNPIAGEIARPIALEIENKL